MKKLVFLSKTDYYEVHLESMLASYDRDILTILYQPIIGSNALALYFTLWAETSFNDTLLIKKHESLVNKMGLELSEILLARQKLEGIGLLKTYKTKFNKSSYCFLYQLYAPKTPKDFFEDVIYKSLLSEKIGEKEVERLAIIFTSKDVLNDDYQDITTEFKSVYSLKESEMLKVMYLNTNYGRKTVPLDSKFEIGELLIELKNAYAIVPSAFSQDDLNEITRVASLLGIDVLTMADVISEIYNPDVVNHIDYQDLLKASINSRSDVNLPKKYNAPQEYKDDDLFGQKLNEFNEFSPYSYLKLKQGSTTPAPGDVKIINMLSQKYNFPNPVINVIVDYSLIKCDDVLSSNYVEKIAATLARKKVTTALNACNVLYGKTKKKAQKIEKENHEEEAIDIEQLKRDLEDL